MSNVTYDILHKVYLFICGPYKKANGIQSRKTKLKALHKRVPKIRGTIQLEKKSSRKNFTLKSYNKKIKLDFCDDFHDDFHDDFFSIELGPFLTH